MLSAHRSQSSILSGHRAHSGGHIAILVDLYKTFYSLIHRWIENVKSALLHVLKHYRKWATTGMDSSNQDCIIICYIYSNDEIIVIIKKDKKKGGMKTENSKLMTAHHSKVFEFNLCRHHQHHVARKQIHLNHEIKFTMKKNCPDF